MLPINLPPEKSGNPTSKSRNNCTRNNLVLAVILLSKIDKTPCGFVRKSYAKKSDNKLKLYLKILPNRRVDHAPKFRKKNSRQSGDFCIACYTRKILSYSGDLVAHGTRNFALNRSAQPENVTPYCRVSFCCFLGFRMFRFEHLEFAFVSFRLLFCFFSTTNAKKNLKKTCELLPNRKDFFIFV